MQDLIAELKQRLVEHLHLEDIRPEEIETDAPLFVEGLGLDSIDAVEIVALLEHEYGIRVTEMETAKAAFSSVGTLASFVQERRGAAVDPVEAEG
jgi:acyl carrier protein